MRNLSPRRAALDLPGTQLPRTLENRGTVCQSNVISCYVMLCYDCDITVYIIWGARATRPPGESRAAESRDPSRARGQAANREAGSQRARLKRALVCEGRISDLPRASRMPRKTQTPDSWSRGSSMRGLACKKCRFVLLACKKRGLAAGRIPPRTAPLPPLPPLPADVTGSAGREEVWVGFESGLLKRQRLRFAHGFRAFHNSRN